jgi:hypothetical protein
MVAKYPRGAGLAVVTPLEQDRNRSLQININTVKSSDNVNFLNSVKNRPQVFFWGSQSQSNVPSKGENGRRAPLPGGAIPRRQAKDHTAEPRISTDLLKSK